MLADSRAARPCSRSSTLRDALPGTRACRCSAWTRDAATWADAARDGPGERRADAGAPGLRHLHLRLDRPAQGRRGPAPRRGQPPPLDARRPWASAPADRRAGGDHVRASTSPCWSSSCRCCTARATVVAAARAAPRSGGAGRADPRRTRATVMQATPATWRLLVARGLGRARPRLRGAVCGGEALPGGAGAAAARAGAGALWNVYGPTETTIWSTVRGGPRRRRSRRRAGRRSAGRSPTRASTCWTRRASRCRWAWRASCTSAARAWRAATWAGRS